MSTADHPQTDGQTERVNRSVEDILRSICAEHPTEWSSMLPFVEFAINNSVHASTGETPFFLNGLRHPRTPVSFVSASASNLSGGGHLAMLDASENALLDAEVLNVVTRGMAQQVAIESPDHDDHVTAMGDTTSVSAKDKKSVAEAQNFIDARAAVIRKVRDAMARAQEKQKENADQHGRKNTEEFKEGDMVLLNTHNLPNEAITCIPGGASKMLPRFIGPYKVVEKISDVNYRINLPTKMKTHPVFYVGRLKRYVDPQEVTYPAPMRLDATGLSARMAASSAHTSQAAMVARKAASQATVNQAKTHADSVASGHQCPAQARPYDALPNRGMSCLEGESCLPIRTSSPLSSSTPTLQSGGQRPFAPELPCVGRGRQKTSRQGTGTRMAQTTRSYSRAAPVPLLDSHGNQRYLVERLVDYRLQQQRPEYLVRWKGWSPAHDSWEPEQTLLEDVPDLVAEYQRNANPQCDRP